MINPNWSRWIKASVAYHISQELPDNLLVEGAHRISLDQEVKDQVELRLDGPDIEIFSATHYVLHIQINCLISTGVRENQLYTQEEVVGRVQELLSQDILIYKYGSGDDDDDSFLGCMVLKQSRPYNQFLETKNFGVIDQKYAMQQSTVEGHYTLEIKTNG